MEFFPLKSGVPVVVRMLSFIKTEVNVSREVGHSRPQSHSVSRTITSGSGCSQKFEFFHWLMKLNAH